MWTFLKSLWKAPRPSREVAECMRLYESVLHRDTEGARIALAHGASPNRKLAMDASGQLQVDAADPTMTLRSPLHVAIDQGDYAAVTVLLAHGAVVESADVALAVRRLSERTDGTIGPRGYLLLALSQHQGLDFSAIASRHGPPLSLADLVRHKQPALAQALGLVPA